MVNRDGFGQICERVCVNEGWELLPTGILVHWKNGRRQLVVLEFVESGDQDLVRLTTNIGPAAALTPSRLTSALRVNAGLAHGALAIRDDHLCMTDTLLLEESGESELEAALGYLAETADRYERTLFDTDDH